MANTLTLNSSIDGRKQFQGAFDSNMFRVKATITDQDAIADGDTASFTVTVPGVQLGDVVVGQSLSVRQWDGTDAYAQIQASVSAANTIEVQIFANTAAFAADALNNAVFRALVCRPDW